MGCQVLSERIEAILLQEHPVEFGFDLRMGHSAAGDLLLYVGVAFAVQHEVADESVQVRPARGCILHIRDDVPGGSEELLSGTVVHPESDGVDAVLHKCVVIEQDIRPMQADVVDVQILDDVPADVAAC